MLVKDIRLYEPCHFQAKQWTFSKTEVHVEYGWTEVMVWNPDVRESINSIHQKAMIVGDRPTI